MDTKDQGKAPQQDADETRPEELGDDELGEVSGGYAGNIPGAIRPPIPRPIPFPTPTIPADPGQD